MSNPQLIKSQVNQNAESFEVFSTEQLIDIWQQKTGKQIAQSLGQGVRQTANYASATLDAAVALKMMDDLGVNGRVVLKEVSGKQYVIFKGLVGHRSIFTGTRYLAQNKKVVDMAIGKVGVNTSILKGARLTFLLIVPLNILNHMLNDQHTMSQLIGETATDIAKLGIATALASVAATATAAVTTLAAGPLVAAIVVGVAASLALDALDRQFGVTDALVQAIDEAYNSTFGELGRQINKVEQHLKWQMLNGQPVGKGIFY